MFAVARIKHDDILTLISISKAVVVVVVVALSPSERGGKLEALINHLIDPFYISALRII